MKRQLQHTLSAVLAGTFLIMAYGSGEDKSKASSALTESQSNVPDVEIIKQSSDYEPTMNSYTIHCRVKNNTPQLVTYLDLQATFYDKQKNIVGTGMGNAANLAAGAEKTIDVMGLDIDNVDTYEVAVNNVIK